MKKFICIFISITNFCFAATPSNGLYLSGFGGAAYLPGNIDRTSYGNYYNQSQYNTGFNAGGSLGYRTDAWRFEAEIDFIKANIKHLNQNGNTIANISGYSQATLGFVDANYDLPFLAMNFVQPYILGGIGYGWLQNNYAVSQNIEEQIRNSAFVYKGGAGLLFNIATTFSVGISYHYLSTTNVNTLGSRFQANLFNGSITYRFDNCELK